MKFPIHKGQQRAGVRFSKGKALVKVWAPRAKTCSFFLSDTGTRLTMQRDARGYWTLETTTIKAGDRYYYELDENQPLPDPASCAQPEGVHGPSQAIDLLAYSWTDQAWRNPELAGYIIYELHTGTFSTEGNFKGIAAHFDHLKKLGITAIELMPVAQFPGTRNWGYDGVFPYCVQNSYGGAEALQDFVNQCHNHGFAVILDVVYNHIGPEGNCLNGFGPYFTDKYKTPWGSAINFDDAGSDAVRDYFIQNALMWLRDFHMDALRLDAVHAIRDFSPVSIIREITEAVAQLNRDSERQHYIILETDQNDSRLVRPRDQDGYGANAQWCDDFHHALRVATGQAQKGYYADFHGITDLAKSFRDAYVYTGQYSEARQRHYGTTTDGLSGDHFIVFSQNHDQVGNRMLGERTSQLVSFELQKLMATLTLTAPFLPLLFMGEEWGAQSPFLYFTDHSDAQLIEAVEQGRKREFAGFLHEGTPPPANDNATYEHSKLNWAELQQQPQASLLQYYRQLIRLRTVHPALHNFDRSAVRVLHEDKEGVLVVERRYKEQSVLCLYNFSAMQHQIRVAAHYAPLHILLSSADRQWRGPGRTQDDNGQAGSISLLPQSAILLANYHVSS